MLYFSYTRTGDVSGRSNYDTQRDYLGRAEVKHHGNDQLVNGHHEQRGNDYEYGSAVVGLPRDVHELNAGTSE